MRALSLPELTTTQNEILRVAFLLLLETSRAVPTDAIQARSNAHISTLDEELANLVTAGRIRLDSSGAVTGAMGLSLDETGHRISIGDTQWFTWCAIDALGILGALDATGAIHSTSPHSGQPIAIMFEDGRPAGGDLSSVVFLASYCAGTPVVDQWCPTINFFETEAAAQDWATTHGVAGECAPLHPAAEVATARWKERLSG
ncbi:hypothetical protein Rhe02_14840 [Rhizocola hellebori]|uniref:Alkylmercury lyase n=1 Tax=Rhizocola hellebori TaxID=1392758 RepID=A0A8J3VEK8_9ACTN|nr:alkylmercury lyase family protein [Rhizocola hellebori]GIH03417.1 hypothetical protein Rhe02_14840 [Rhizocola hellebori]